MKAAVLIGGICVGLLLGCAADRRLAIEPGLDGGCQRGPDDPACDVCLERATSVVDLVADQDHVCALIDDGRVFCWGDNSLGSLGLGEGAAPMQLTEEVPGRTGAFFIERNFSPLPIQVPGLTGVTSLSSSLAWSNCALDRGGEVRCFGPNFEPSTGFRGEVYWVPTVPPETVGLTGLRQVAVGRVVKFVLDDRGQVWGWGEVRHDILGTELLDSWCRVGDPAVAAGITGATVLETLHETTCVIVEGGRVSCWGGNIFGQAGDPAGAADHRVGPTAVVGVEDAIALAAGEVHVCALLSTGRVSCWGADGKRGEAVSTGGFGFSAEATPVEGLTGIVALEASYNATCAIGSDGGLTCWGPPPEYRRLGNTNRLAYGDTGTHRPMRIEGASNVIDVAFGGLVYPDNIDATGRLLGTLCVLERCGRVRCMGRNVLGQLGDGTTNDSLEFIDVIGLP